MEPSGSVREMRRFLCSVASRRPWRSNPSAVAPALGSRKTVTVVGGRIPLVQPVARRVCEEQVPVGMPQRPFGIRVPVGDALDLALGEQPLQRRSRRRTFRRRGHLDREEGGSRTRATPASIDANAQGRPGRRGRRDTTGDMQDLVPCMRAAGPPMQYGATATSSGRRAAGGRRRATLRSCLRSRP